MQNLWSYLEMQKYGSLRVCLGCIDFSMAPLDCLYLAYWMTSAQVNAQSPIKRVRDPRYNAKSEGWIGDTEKIDLPGFVMLALIMLTASLDCLYLPYSLTSTQVNAQSPNTLGAGSLSKCKIWGLKWRCQKILLLGFVQVALVVPTASSACNCYEYPLTCEQFNGQILTIGDSGVPTKMNILRPDI